MAFRAKRITTRWLTGSLGLIFLILALVEAAFALGLRMFYYNSAQQVMMAQANTVSALLTKYADDPASDYAQETRSVIENFDDRDTMELMALDFDGGVMTTSSGFEITEKMEMPDFEEAMSSESGTGSFRGMIGGENVLAVTVRAPSAGNSLAAVRLIASLSRVDSLLRTLTIFALAVGAAILFFMILSGVYFINSIVIPVGEIGKTARRIAQGDFATRLEKKNDDEIGDLCETINDMAEELGTAEKMKNDFISSVSHELRTPLTAIKGWSETILATGESDPDTLKKGMRVINSETDRLSLMVEELLDFSRIQSGRLRLIFEKIDLLAELEEAVLMYTEKARREGIGLEYEEELESAVVIADKNRLRQVFINIIDNAIKYSDAGGMVRVSAYAQEEWFVFRVADSGCGISPEDLPHVKQKFYKANLTRRGSGIGLAVADEIVSAHRGSLEVTSELGVGTTVTIRIPNAHLFERLSQEQRRQEESAQELGAPAPEKEDPQH